MKKFLLLSIASMFVLTSCNRNDGLSGTEEESGNVAVTISADLSSTALNSKAGLNPGSQNSGLDNVDPDVYDVRYIMEVLYDGNVVNRAVNTEAVDKPSGTSFTLNLVRGKTYRFVVWADFVLKGGVEDLHYKTTSGLSSIEMISTSFKMNDESKDAYFVSEERTISTSTSPSSISLTLKRPLAKIRFIATDYSDIVGETLTEVQTNYVSNTSIYNTFNAVTGEVGAAKMTNPTITAKKDVTPVIISANKEAVMFWDYVFVPATDATAGLKLGFTVSYKPYAATISQSYTQTQIVVKPNMLTTVKANFFTAAQTINVTIDERFDDHLYPLTSKIYIGETGYTTIAAAMATAVSGDVITLLEGIYDEDVNVKAGVTLQGAGSATVIKGYITVGAGATLKNLRSYYLGKKLVGGTSTRTALFIDGSDVTIDGVVFDTGDGRAFTSASNKNEAIVTSGATGLIFTNNTINEPYWKGIYMNSSQGAVITGNTFNKLNPFSVDNYYPMTITGNTFIRDGISGNTQMIHLVVPGVTQKNTSEWTQDLMDQVVQVKLDNTWVESTTIANGSYSHGIRIQGYIVGKAGNNPAVWTWMNP